MGGPRGGDNTSGAEREEGEKWNFRMIYCNWV